MTDAIRSGFPVQSTPGVTPSSPNIPASRTASEVESYVPLHEDVDELKSYNVILKQSRRIVTEFGAVGDGVTDDSVAIQTALDAVSTVGGGLVELPVGIFMIGTTLLHRSNVTLSGHGAQTILRRSPTLVGALIKNESYNANVGNWVPATWVVDHDMALRDLALDGDKAAEPFDDASNGAVYSRCVRVSCRGVSVYDCQNDGIIYEYCRYCAIEGCWSYRNSKAGLYLSGCDWCVVSGNLVYENWGGLSIATSFYVSVFGNVLVQNQLHGQIETAMGLHGGRGGESSIVFGNISEGMDFTALDPAQANVFDDDHPVAETYVPGQPMGQYRSQVVHNIIVGHAGYGLTLPYSRGNIVDGNHILGNGASVYVAGSQDNVLRGNYLFENALSGAYAGIDVSREGVPLPPENTGNQIVDNFLDRGSQGTMAGIRVLDGEHDNLVHRNRLRGAGVVVDATYADNHVRANIEGTPPSAIHVLADSVTPSVQSARACQTAFAAPTTVTNFTDGVAGQEIIVVVGAQTTTINSGGNFRLSGAAAFVGAPGATIAFVYVGGVWTETARTA